ncbi:MAG: hypothetical protein K8S23_07850 [Candidatus Cloacimonetes bacterium]|nr:hypothetical protein [Candidatus Cloacimonadota bacterium]
MKRYLILLIIFVVILLGSCAIPNEPKIDNDQKLEIETYYQTVGYARDVYVTNENVFIAEDQAGFSIFNLDGSFILQYTASIDNARLITVLEEDSLLFVYDIYSDPAAILVFDISNLPEISIKPPITGQTGGIEDLIIKRNEESGDNEVSWTYENKVRFGTYNGIWEGQANFNSYQNSVAGLDYSEENIFVCGEQIGVYISSRETSDLQNTINTAGQALDVRFVDNKIFVACREEGLEIIDVLDIQNPNLIYSTDTSGYAQSIDVEGDILAVASGGGGLYVYDISNLENVTLIGNLSAEIGYTYKTFIKNGKIYAATKDGVYKIVVKSG